MILDFLKKLFKLGVVAKEEKKEEYKLISKIPPVYEYEYSEIPIKLELDIIPSVTSWVAYEDEVYDLDIPFRIVYPGTDVLAVTRHPKGYMTSAYPYKMSYMVNVYGIEPPYEGKLLFVSIGIVERFYDTLTNEVKTNFILDKFKIPRFIEIPKEVERLNPVKFAVSYTWNSFKIPYVLYPVFLGGDNKFHPAIVESGEYKRARVFEILPYDRKPWFRK